MKISYLCDGVPIESWFTISTAMKSSRMMIMFINTSHLTEPAGDKLFV